MNKKTKSIIYRLYRTNKRRHYPAVSVTIFTGMHDVFVQTHRTAVYELR